jgi:hypothetical protein
MDMNTSESGRVNQPQAERVIRPSTPRPAPKGEEAVLPGQQRAIPVASGEDSVDLSEAVRTIGGESPEADAFGDPMSLKQERREQILRRIGDGSYDWPESRVSVMRRLARELGLLP